LKEQHPKIGRLSVLWYFGDEMLDVSFKCIEVGDLGSCKVWSNKRLNCCQLELLTTHFLARGLGTHSAVFPMLAVTGENASSKQLPECFKSLSEAEILEVGRQNSLDVFWVYGADDGASLRCVWSVIAKEGKNKDRSCAYHDTDRECVPHQIIPFPAGF
jgi:hypothetical protein